MSIDGLRDALAFDPDTGIITWKQRGYKRTIGREAGCKDKLGYRRITYKRRPFGGHVIAWALHYGEWPSLDIDHANGIRDDNRICNLRLATDSQNQANRRRSVTSTSGFKGVTRIQRACARPWVAAVKVNGRNVYLGCFDAPESAHEAYMAAARHYFGEFARAA